LSGFLLDTPILTAFLLGRRPAIDFVGTWAKRNEAATSIIVYGEIIEYLSGRSDFVERRAQLRRVLSGVPPLFLNFSTLEHYAEIRRRLRPPHGPGLIGDIDILIAATALENEMTLVSTDRDFERVEGLSVLLLERKTFATISDSTP
jgi:predicted nucleic acid-binding protein